MKTILLPLFALLFSNLYASVDGNNGIDLYPDEVRVEKISSYSHVSTSLGWGGTTVAIKLITGCIDRFGPIGHKAILSDDNKTLNIYMMATTTINKNSSSVRCIKANTKLYTVTVPVFDIEQVNVHML